MTGAREAKHPARAAARLAAVQALYQMETVGVGVDAVVREFLAHRIDGEIEGQALHKADAAMFEDIVRGVVAGQRRIDRAITARLADNWKLERIDSIARGILRAAVYEIGMRPDIPFRVIIDEYVELARDFFGEGVEPGFINGVLDAVSRTVREEGVGDQ